MGSPNMVPVNHPGKDTSISSGTSLQSAAMENVHPLAGVADLVMETARVRPESIALSYGADSMTFRELAVQSARMATYLISLGAGPDVPIALCLERSFDFI